MAKQQYVQTIRKGFLEEQEAIDDLREACLLMGEENRITAFIEGLTDPKGFAESILVRARKAKINPLDLLDILRRHRHMKGLLILTNSIPKLCGDIVKDSESREVCCRRCDGWKEVTTNKGDKEKKMQCPECKGTGVTWQEGSKDARQLALEMLHLIKNSGRGGQINVNLSIGSTPESIIDRFEEIEKQRTVQIEGKAEELA